MKTMKFRLLATMITLAAVITTTTIPANAQRRSTGDSEKDKKTEAKHSEKKSNVEKKGTYKDIAIEPKANNRKVSNDREVRRYSSNSDNSERERNKASARSSENEKKHSSVNYYANKTGQNRNDDKGWTDTRRNNGQTENRTKNANGNFSLNRYEQPRRSTGYSERDNRNDENLAVNTNRSSANTRDRYNHNDDDARYRPNRDYRGNEKYWSPEVSRDNHHRNIYDKKYNWYNYNHWDRNWEAYKWNNKSWRNYYGFYDPYSYRHHKYYYHHHYYGHVIRKFVSRPQIYIHNHVKYYCYDGFFFRHIRGVGYVLVDVPFGFTFNYLPDNYEMVYINGYMYFRVGNLFFENTKYGFSLVHYPERYFSYNDGYMNEGYRFDDMY